MLRPSLSKWHLRKAGERRKLVSDHWGLPGTRTVKSYVLLMVVVLML